MIDPRKIEVLDDEMVAIYRAMTPGQKIRMGCEFNRIARDAVGSYLRSKHADWTDEQVSTEIARWVLGEELWSQLPPRGTPR